MSRLAALAILILVASCGTNRVERTLSGGAIGAGAGALGAALVHGSVGTGLVVGSLVGAAAGGLTDSNQLYLGESLF